MLARTFGSARFAYNYMLRLRTDAWYQRQERVGYHESSAVLTALKKTPEHAWLNEVSSIPVQQALRHLQTAFANFFAKRAQYPNIKRKDGAQSAEYATSALKWDGVSLNWRRWTRRLRSVVPHRPQGREGHDGHAVERIVTESAKEETSRTSDKPVKPVTRENG